MTSTVINSYDNSKGRYAGYSFYIDEAEINFFVYVDKKVIKIPFNITTNITKGNITLKNNKYLEMMKNIMDSYSSYVEKGRDIVTLETQSLKLYRMMNFFITHNVFTSVVYVSSVCIPKSFINITNYIANILKLETLDLFNTNYYLHFYNNENARRISIIETKIYFWWYLFSKEQNFNDNGFFVFYLWVFNNLNNLNEPTIFGKNNERIIPFYKYFELIEKTTRLTDLFILRYGPKYLSEEELRDKPSNIYNHFDFIKCKNNLRDYISFLL